MPTRDELKAQLEAQRESLEKPFADAGARGDKATQDKLEAVAAQIDLALDQIALLDLADLAGRLAEIRGKIEKLTGNAQAWPFRAIDAPDGDEEPANDGAADDAAGADAGPPPLPAAPAPGVPPAAPPAGPPPAINPPPPVAAGVKGMRLSPKGANLIKHFESCMKPVAGGFRAYLDPVNVLTIGWGHTNHNGRQFDAATVWTQAECDAVFLEDMAVFEDAVKSLVKANLNQDQFDALASFTFNCGKGNLAASTLLKMVNAGDFAGAAQQFQRWNKAKGQVLPGLVRRRACEALLFQSIPDSNYDGIPD